ncbi:MAG: hypothetical protein EOM62_17985 [Bacteroidia bacterium]|nr:hypothetical protein [Bacteroidia bacterium]
MKYTLKSFSVFMGSTEKPRCRCGKEAGTYRKNGDPVCRECFTRRESFNPSSKSSQSDAN